MNQRYFVKAFALSLGMSGFWMGMENLAFAQLQNPQEPPVYQSSEQDPSKGSFTGFDPTSLIHNSNLSRSRNGSDFAEDTQRNLNKAAENFKLQQQQQLQKQPANVPPTEPITLPAQP